MLRFHSVVQSRALAAERSLKPIPQNYGKICRMTTLITGASSGVGEALALACAARKDTLFLCGRNHDRLNSVAEKCRSLGAKVYADVLDVADEAKTRLWIANCNEIASLERVFANAGVSTGEETEENVRKTFAINVGGVLNTVLPAVALFRRHGGGQAVITASIAGYGPLKACPSYSATKACVKTWGLALRGALAGENIKINVVCPGFIRSRMTDGNTCPMPFFLEADKAAQIILRGVDRNRGLIAFPWPMRLGTWWLSILPYWFNALLNRLLPKKVI